MEPMTLIEDHDIDPLLAKASLVLISLFLTVLIYSTVFVITL